MAIQNYIHCVRNEFRKCRTGPCILANICIGSSLYVEQKATSFRGYSLSTCTRKAAGVPANVCVCVCASGLGGICQSSSSGSTLLGFAITKI